MTLNDPRQLPIRADFKGFEQAARVSIGRGTVSSALSGTGREDVKFRFNAEARISPRKHLFIGCIPKEAQVIIMPSSNPIGQLSSACRLP
jgi:hypothetical protein